MSGRYAPFGGAALTRVKAREFWCAHSGPMRPAGAALGWDDGNDRTPLPYA